MKHLISVVIPCYNSEPYLKTCLDSVLRQTWPYWECIVVNDGSTDASAALAADYAATDPRIRVVTIAHAGVSYAVARGVEEAAGQWLYFLDSDDWIDPNELERLYRTVTDNSCDMICSDFIIEEESGSNLRSIVRFQGVVEQENFPKVFYPHLLCNTRYSGLVCGNTRSGKLVRREMALRHISCQLGMTFAEDALLMLNILLDCQRVYGDAGRSGYHYRMHGQSSMHNYGFSLAALRIDYAHRLRQLFDSRGIAGIPALEGNYCQYLLYCVLATVRQVGGKFSELKKSQPEIYGWFADTVRSIPVFRGSHLPLRDRAVLILLRLRLYRLLCLLYDINHFIRYKPKGV